MKHDDLISREQAIDAVTDELDMIDHVPQWVFDRLEKRLKQLPIAQPPYEELTLEEAASEIASGSLMSARYWLNVMIQLQQMGYAICMKR